MSNRIICNFDEDLMRHIDQEKGRTGATRNGVIVRILENHFAEQQEKQKLYDEWFTAEVEKGLASARTEPLIDHTDALRRINEAISKAKVRHAS